MARRHGCFGIRGGKMRLQVVSAVLTFAVFADISGASGEAIITGTPDGVRVNASKSTVEEVLSGLRDKFGLSYRSATVLDQTVDGSYAGTLAGVLKRLLAGYNYVLKSELGGENGALVVAVLDKSNSVARPGSPTTPAALAWRAAGEGNSSGEKSDPAPVLRGQAGLGNFLKTQLKLLAPARPGVGVASKPPTTGDSSQASPSAPR